MAVSTRLYLAGDAEKWIAEALAQHGASVTRSIIVVHERPWSLVSRVPSSVGNLYFKAVAPPLAFEPLLTQALAQICPEKMPGMLAIHAQQGWMLMGDGGQTLRQVLRYESSLAKWNEVLADYARLQVALTGQIDALLGLGVRDRRLDVLPKLYEDLLADKTWLLIDHPEGITGDAYQQLVQTIPLMKELCVALAECSVPVSLHHNDLHDGNVFYGDRKPRFFDWGDSSIAHPFFSLRTVFVSIGNRFGLPENDALFADLVQTYLRPWQQFASGDQLEEAFGLARRIWSLSSAVKYMTQIKEIPAMRAEYATAVPHLLLEFLAANRHSLS